MKQGEKRSLRNTSRPLFSGGIVGIFRSKCSALAKIWNIALSCCARFFCWDKWACAWATVRADADGFISLLRFTPSRMHSFVHLFDCCSLHSYIYITSDNTVPFQWLKSTLKWIEFIHIHLCVCLLQCSRSSLLPSPVPIISAALPTVAAAAAAAINSIQCATFAKMINTNEFHCQFGSRFSLNLQSSAIVVKRTHARTHTKWNKSKRKNVYVFIHFKWIYAEALL